MALTEQNNISIAEIAIYTPSLAIAIWLSIKHGFGRSSGWLYLIIFSLARIIGAGLQLGTISQPRNISLYIGAATLANIGLGPLILVELGLLSRALTSIRKSTHTFVNECMIRIIQLLVLIGPILGAVGGSQSGTDYARTGVYAVTDTAKGGVGCMIAGFILTVLITAQVGMQISHAEPGEHRLVLAVALSLPFILVRLAYSAETTFGNNPSFNLLTGNINIQLGMAIVVEMIAVAIIEGIALTLKKIPNSAPGQSASASRAVRIDSYETGPYQERAQSGSRR